MAGFGQPSCCHGLLERVHCRCTRTTRSPAPKIGQLDCHITDIGGRLLRCTGADRAQNLNSLRRTTALSSRSLKVNDRSSFSPRAPMGKLPTIDRLDLPTAPNRKRHDPATSAARPRQAQRTLRNQTALYLARSRVNRPRNSAPTAFLDFAQRTESAQQRARCGQAHQQCRTGDPGLATE